jgi:flagellar biosynthesis chaperone FliJ
MARDKLRVLLSMRRRSVEQARYTLGACLAAESEAAEKIRTLDDTARRDRETGAVWQDSHRFLEISTSRQDIVRAQRRIIMADLTAAETCSEDARAVVATARSAAEAVEQIISERTAASRTEAIRREQHVLDDITRTRIAGRQRP